MKIFIDTGNFAEITRFKDVIDGITTNPTLIAKEKYDLSFESYIEKISKIFSGPISIEVLSTKTDKIVEESKKFSNIAPNVVIKVPMTRDGLIAVKKLRSLDIQTNVTLVFSQNQALLAAKSGATYASIFVGRLDDIGVDAIEIVKNTRKMYDIYNYPTQIISASIRHPKHVIDAALAGTHVITIPPQIIDKLYAHPLTDIGLAQFLEDWKTGAMRIENDALKR